MSGAVAPSRPARTELLLGVALVVAISPGLYDLLRHWALEPWSRYSALFVPLSLWLALRTPVGAPLRGLGVGAVAAGLVLQLLAVLAAMPALARPAAVVALSGFALARGWMAPSVVAVALFIVPVPYQLTDWTGGDRAAAELFQTAASVLRVFGVGVAAGDRHVISGDADLPLDSTYGGLPTAVAMAGLLVFVALRLRPDGKRLARWAVALALAGAASQLFAFVLAGAAVAGGRAGLAVFCASTLPWLLPAVPAWLVAERQAARSARTR